MADNFRILSHRSESSLHLKLTGDFDGSSAHELFNILKTKMHSASRVFVHTNGLQKIHPFGRDVFRSFSEVKKFPSIIFTGDKAAQLAPECMKLA